MINNSSLRKANIGRLAILATTFIWGTSFVLLKRTLDLVPIMYILAFRFLGAALLMLPFCAKDLKKIDGSYLMGGTLMGICLFVAYVLQTYGLVYTTPGKNAFLTAVYCVLVPFLIWIIHRKRPDKYNVIAGFICIAGIGCVSLESDFTVNIGDLLTLVCGLFFGLHIIVTGRYSKGRNPFVLTMIQFAWAAVLSWGGVLAFEAFPPNIHSSALWSIVYMCIMCTGVCFVLQTFGQKYTPPSSVSILLTLEAVFGVLASVIFYGEILTVKVLLGFALIFISVLLSETKLSFLGKRSGERGIIKGRD